MTNKTDLVLSGDAPADFCAVQSVTRADGSTARCALCFQREGNPGDCQAGARFTISFGAAGGVMLCHKAMVDLADKMSGAGIDLSGY